MSARIAKLEQLLSRVIERRSEVRVVAQAGAAETLELDDPGMETAEIDELDAPEAGAPELDVPELDAPEMDAPELDAPELDAPEMDAPELDAPSLDEPDMELVGEEEEVLIDEIDEVEIEEDAPESGPIKSSMERAISSAASETPLTPPPESGEEVSDPSIPPREGPTMEQLGQTIALEEGGASDLELDEPIVESVEELEETDDIEIEPPAPSVAPAMTLPENAQEELDRHRLGEATPLAARISTRPVLSTAVVELVSASKEFSPKSFKELLQASLELK